MSVQALKPDSPAMNNHRTCTLWVQLSHLSPEEQHGCGVAWRTLIRPGCVLELLDLMWWPLATNLKEAKNEEQATKQFQVSIVA